MTCDEFSREFDVLWNNITSNQAPSLNSYEKSVFLTQAQEEIILSIYNKKDWKDTFDLTEEVTSYLASLIKSANYTEFARGDCVGLTSGKYVVDIPANMRCADYWFIVYESALVSYEGKCGGVNIHCDVVPATYDTLDMILKNPFKRPNKNRILSIYHNDECDGSKSRYLIHSSDVDITKYHVTALVKPKPIVLGNFDIEFAGLHLSVNGYKERMNCEVSDALHRSILNRAVELAKISWDSTLLNSQQKQN